jgi:ribose/xylose/arabinose/galactoside ABC-type transport system permease subunit
MNLLNIESYTQDIVLGAVILIAVVFDELRKRYLTR